MLVDPCFQDNALELTFFRGSETIKGRLSRQHEDKDTIQKDNLTSIAPFRHLAVYSLKQEVHHYII